MVTTTMLMIYVFYQALHVAPWI